jgi:hypothetical protein
MPNEIAVAQLARREELKKEIATLFKAWPALKASLDNITELLALPGVNATRTFFVLASNGNSDSPVEPIERWAAYRLSQLEAIEVLSQQQQALLNVSKQTIANSDSE